MRHLLVASVTVCCLTLALAAGHDQCRLADIPIHQHFDQTRFTGVWYEVEYYPYTWPLTYTPKGDYSYVITEVKGQPGRSEIRRNYKAAGDDQCGPETINIRDEIRPGYYIDTEPDNSQSTRIIAYTDYDRFAVEFVCYEKDGDICKSVEVLFWSRTKRARAEDIALGRGLVSRLCGQPDQRYTVVQNQHSTCNRRVNRQCRFDDIPIADQFSSERATGKWFVVRYYVSGLQEPSQVLEELSYTVDGANRRLTRNARRRNGKCIDFPALTPVEKTSGVFEILFDPTYNKTTYFKAAYASNNRQYGILFICPLLRDGICIDPAVQFVTRGKSVLTSGELSELEMQLKDLCVDPSVFEEPVHKEGCPDEKGTDSGIKPGQQPSPDDMYRELVRAQTEMLLASRDKFRAETEALGMRKEKIQLEIQRLRQIYPWN